MQYRAGNVTVQTGSNVVIGDGTEWIANAPVGAPFTIERDLVSYQVASVVSDTELRLSAPYEGLGGINLFYSIHTSFTPKRGYPLLQPGDVEGLLILNRAVQMVDNDMPSGGAAGVQNIDDLLDVDVSTALTGYALIRQADGLWKGQAIASGGVKAENAGLPTTNSAAILKIVGDTLSLRRIVGDGISVTENPDSITLTPTSIGEVATMRNLGTAGSFGAYKQKTNKEFQLFAFRAGTGIQLSQAGDEVVISSTVTGGGGTGTTSPTTASNVGTGFLKLVKNKVNDDIKFRSISFDSLWFEATIDEAQDTYTVKGKQQAFGSLQGIDLTGAQTGTYLYLDSDNIFKARALPNLGITSLSQDPNPTLSAPLNTAGQRILGVSRTKTIVIEKPKVRRYPIELLTPRNENLLSVVCRTEVGEVDFSVLVNSDGEVSENGIFWKATTEKVNAIPPAPISSPVGSFVDLRVDSATVDASWIVVELNFISV
jgi:hypothetical protein